MAVAIGKITSQELLTDPDCFPASANSVSTSRTAYMRVVGQLMLGKILLGFIAWLNLLIPHE